MHCSLFYCPSNNYNKNNGRKWSVIWIWSQFFAVFFCLWVKGLDNLICVGCFILFSKKGKKHVIVFLCVFMCFFFVFFFSPGVEARQWGGRRRWVWRVIPHHLSINPETISSIPRRMSKPRWAEDESIIFFLRLSPEFPSKHINTQCAIIFYCPPFTAVNGGPQQWVNVAERVVFYAEQRQCLKTTGCDRILCLSPTSLCMRCDGACAGDLLSNRKWDT